ncbi:hypothetical protein OG394_05610 [Kribbella sp. NBC_01245]|uniref:trypsin-like serine peptidase n=1 Tax=Kribbella sp. NBC_01245 TaxID=2903578 RepID=UPI002E2CE62F|nr:hypothetical protein [Kribbella sp. NBC_01245]
MRTVVRATLLSFSLLAAPISVPAATAAAPAGITTVGPSAQAQARSYWTPSRLRAAVPVEKLMPKATLRSTLPVRLGAPAVVQPTAAAAAPVNAGSAWTFGGAIVKTEGRVFFLYGGRKASCSGTAVTSANKSTVITAGHCVRLGGAWHTNWVFVPAYNNGTAPYGTWTARLTSALPQWVASESFSYDVGAAVVDSLGGKLLTDVVGGQGITFSSALLKQVYAFGYPAAAPYDGTKLIYSSGAAVLAIPLFSDGYGLVSNLTGGASGGGWFQSFDPATGRGLLTSVNSYKIALSNLGVPLDVPAIFGPKFGADTQTLYNAMQKA